MMRYAIYFTPPHDDPLTRVAVNWLGRDAFTGQPVAVPSIGSMEQAEIAFHTAAPRRYGFHATLKAPFRLAADTSEAQLVAAFDAFCASRAAFFVPKLEIRQLDGFFALVPAEPHGDLNALAADCVRALDRFRAPLGEDEAARRQTERMQPRELRYLQQWGYPYVFDAFRFHMTLTGRVPPGEADRMRRTLAEFLGPILQEPVEVANLALFVEPEPGAPFIVHRMRAFGAAQERKSA